MRKRNISYLFDTLFWFLMWLLPALFYLFNYLAFDINSAGVSIASFSQFIVDNFGISTSSTLYSSLFTIFADDNYLGVIDTTISNSLILYFVYIFFIELIHIFTDVILFIPRFAHNFIARFQEVTND